MPWCVVVGCRNNLKATKRSGKHVSYHIFPKNPQRRNAWINSLNQPFKLNADSSYICSEHFVPDDFECYSLKEELLNIKVKRQLKKTAIPSINMSPSLEDQVETDSLSLNGINNFNGKFKNSNQLDMQKYYAMLNYNSTIDNNSKNQKEAKIYNSSIVLMSMHSMKELKIDEVSTLKNGTTIIDVKTIQDDFVKLERKKLVDKLLADYEEQQKINEGHLTGTRTNYSNFFSPKINPNAKLGDKLKLLKSIDNPEMNSVPKKRKLSSSSKISLNSKSLELPLCNNLSQNKDQIIQVSAVKGGLMLHALPPTLNNNNLSTSHSGKNITEEEEEIIIVTEDEASFVDLSSYETHRKENNTEVIIVTNLRETEETLRHVESLPNKCSSKIKNDIDKCHEQNQLVNNKSLSTPSYTAKVSLSEEKSCQVLIPCKGCEHRSLKINKLLRERTRLLKDLNQNGTWKDPDELTTLRKMNGVLSLLLLQCVGEKYGKKSSPVRIDLVKDSIERIDQGWSMQDTSETLCQALSINAYDEFARKFEIIHET